MVSIGTIVQWICLVLSRVIATVLRIRALVRSVQLSVFQSRTEHHDPRRENPSPAHRTVSQDTPVVLRRHEALG